MERSFRHPDFKENFVGSVYELWRNGNLCDAAIEVGSRVFKFHKIVLAVSSPEFFNMDENKLVIQLPVETDISALEAVLQYVYGGELQLTQYIVESVQYLATMFKIDKVLEFCEIFHSELTNKAKHSNAKTVSSERYQSGKEKKPLRKSCGPSKGRGRCIKIKSENSKIGHAKDTLHMHDKETCKGSACVSPTKGRGRGKCRKGKVPEATSLLKACKIKTKSENDNFSEEEKPWTAWKDSLRTSRKRKTTVDLQSETLAGVVKEELNSLFVSDSYSPFRSGRKSRKDSPLTRAEIQKAYRARKMEKMSPEELEEYRKKERERVRKNKCMSSFSCGKGKEKRKKVSKRACSQSKTRLKKKMVDIKSEPILCKVEEHNTMNSRKISRQKRYRDRMKNDPEWRRKEAERVRKRYIPVSQLSKKELKQRRLRESERTRLWRLKKKQQMSSVPIDMSKDNQSLTDIGGKILVPGNMHETLSCNIGQDLVGNSCEMVQPDGADVHMVNSIIHSLNDQFQYMLVGNGNIASQVVKTEVTDLDYHSEETVALIEPLTDNDVHQTVDPSETRLCSIDSDQTDELETCDKGHVSDFHIKTEDEEMIICEVNHESVSDVNDDVDDTDNDCNHVSDYDNDCDEELILGGIGKHDRVSEEEDHGNRNLDIASGSHFNMKEVDITLNENEEVNTALNENKGDATTLSVNGNTTLNGNEDQLATLNKTGNITVNESGNASLYANEVIEPEKI